MSDLAAFISARLTDDAERWWAVHDLTICDAILYEEDLAAAAAETPDCDCGYPARVLREVEAKRSILALHLPDENDPDAGHGELRCQRCQEPAWPCSTLRALAAAYGDHSGYDQAWAPS